MIKYKRSEVGVIDKETGANIPFAEGNRHFKEYMEWCAEGNSPEPEFSEAELAAKAKDDAIAEIIAEYKANVQKPVTCVTSSGDTFVMDAKADSPVKMRDGIEFAELSGQTTMDIVDYDNRIHQSVPLASCREIMLQQAQAYIANYMKKNLDRQVILDS